MNAFFKAWVRVLPQELGMELVAGVFQCAAGVVFRASAGGG